jgi:uncharacterized membrane protein SpoIIM required for sporulation
MVLESLITAKLAENDPWKMLPLSFIYSSVAVVLSSWIFPSNDLAVVAFTVIASIPLMVSIMRFEEDKEEMSRNINLGLHKQLLPFFAYFFFGLTLSFTFWFSVLPAQLAGSLFSSQLHTINDINSYVVSGNIIKSGEFWRIFLNNVRVLAFAIIFSLLYGAGAIFIITWNASLVGVAIASLARSSVAVAAGTTAGHYVTSYSLQIVKYMLHGMPEIMGYFVGGLAGGILSVSLVKKEFGTELFNKALKDFSMLCVISVVFLFVAALIEVGVSSRIII